MTTYNVYNRNNPDENVLTGATEQDVNAFFEQHVEDHGKYTVSELRGDEPVKLWTSTEWGAEHETA